MRPDNRAPRWRLASLEPANGVRTEPVERARDLVERWHSDTTTPAGLASALDEIGDIRTGLARIAHYLTLRDADGSFGDEEFGLEEQLDDVIGRVEELLSVVPDLLDRLDDGTFRELVEDPELARYRWYLLRLRSESDETQQDHEQASSTDDQVLRDVWIETAEFSGSVDAAITVALDLPASHRDRILDAITRELSTCVDDVVAGLNAVVGQRVAATADRAWRTARDNENQVDSEHVDAALTTITAATPTAHQWWRYRLRSSDPIHTVPFGRACRIIETALDAMSPVLGDVLRLMLTERTIDAEPRPGKHGNAFCLLPSPNDPPFVLLNYEGHPRDLFRLAHEVGHAVHYVLAARRQPALCYEAPPLTSELAAFLIETQVIDHLLVTASPAERSGFGLAVGDHMVNSLFRQAAITQWEQRLCEYSATVGPFDGTTVRSLWREEAHYLEPLLDSSNAFELDWMRVPHIAREAFYNSTYAVAYLLMLARLAAGPPSHERFLAFLSAGAGCGVLDQLDILGVPLDSTIWRRGIGEVESRLACCVGGIAAAGRDS